MFFCSSYSRRGQSLVEVSVVIALIALTVIAGLSLVGGPLTALYARANCSLFAVTASTIPTTCSLPSSYPLTGPDATFINPAFAVQYSTNGGTFIGGNQCTPDCPFGAKFIGLPNFVNDPNYDAYASGIFDVVDKNQCTYGAIAEWLTIHKDQTDWSPANLLLYAPIQDNAGSMYQRAANAGYTVSSTPLSGSMVVYKNGWAGSSNGHIATVVGVSADGKHYTVVEQNLLYVELNDESGAGFPPYRWNIGGFDIRTAQFPDSEIAGFIYGPPGTTLPTDQATITGYVGPSPSP